MPKDPTPEEGVPLSERYKRLTGGYKKDVELPNRSGRRDPRLGASREEVANALRSATKGLTQVRKLTGSR